MKKQILTKIKKPLQWLSELECLLSRHWVSSAHKRLRKIEWQLLPQPEHFDHHIDLYYQWLATKNSLWIERGVFSSLVLQGGDVLELACGDGFNARNFYSLRSRQVIACDFDPRAIQTALRKNTTPNVKFQLSDIRTHMPQGKFGNIILDAAIEHFTPTEIEKLMKEIKSRLTDKGILSGYTIIERTDGKKSLSHHEYEFRNKEDLMRFLTPHFKNVTVFETIHPNRHNLYFWAGNTDLPFTPKWEYSIHKTVN